MQLLVVTPPTSVGSIDATLIPLFTLGCTPETLVKGMGLGIFSPQEGDWKGTLDKLIGYWTYLKAGPYHPLQG